MKNICDLLISRARSDDPPRIGPPGRMEPLTAVLRRAAAAADQLLERGVGVGDRVALIGVNSVDYLQNWIALQLVGAAPAMVNPTYPAQLLDAMMDDLQPSAVVWSGREMDLSVRRSAVHIDGAELFGGSAGDAARDPACFPGALREPGDLAGMMHTSGTTGVPKFCAQSHRYFVRLAEYIATGLLITRRDTVYAPLPLFHINPLGYGVLGGLFGRADVMFAERFSASRFWADVKDNGATVLILHGPPVEILKRRAEAGTGRDHNVRLVFYADESFMGRFGIHTAVAAYGSTEAGGLCHMHIWRYGDSADERTGMSTYGGRPRFDVDWKLGANSEIMIRGREDGVIFDGYLAGGKVVPPFDSEGWFATGDTGRVDDAGELVFVERATEAIRSRGEFVPVTYVEEHFAQVDGVDDLALWKERGALNDDELVLYVAGDVSVEALSVAAQSLPKLLRPAKVVYLSTLPRDAGVGKVSRRLLDSQPVLRAVGLS